MDIVAVLATLAAVGVLKVVYERGRKQGRRDMESEFFCMDCGNSLPNCSCEGSFLEDDESNDDIIARHARDDFGDNEEATKV